MSPARKNQFTPVDVLQAENKQGIVIDGVTSALRKNPRLEWLILLALSAVMLGQLSLSVRQLSQTWDEAVHLYSGYRYLKCGDLTFSPEHPPLAKIIAAAPLVSRNSQVNCVPFHGDDYDAFANATVWLYSTDWRSELFQARLAVSVFSIFLCDLVWVAARRMFGLGIAFLATLLLIFEPNLLANGALVTTDMAVTAMLFFAVFGLYLCTRRPCIPLLALTGMAVGLTLLAKLSGVVIIPVLIILAVADACLPQDGKQPLSKLAPRNLAMVGLILFIAYAVLWAGYGMRYAAQPGPSLGQESPSSLPSTSVAGRTLLALETHHLLPQAYLEGFSFLLLDVDSPRSAPMFILGKFYPRAPWFSLPVNFLIRCTIGFLAITLLSVVGIMNAFAKHRREIVFLLVPIVFFAAGFMHAGWNAGIRHMLPMLPFLMILAAAGCLELAKHLRWGKYAVLCLIVLHAASSLHAFPNYLSYGNEFWGGPTRSYKYLEGIDLGQSYWQAKAYMEKHPSDKCWLITDGLPLSEFYGVPCEHIGHLRPGLAPSQMNGTVLVSSWALSSTNIDTYGVEPFENIHPADTIGGSAILVYKGNFDTRAIASMSETLLARESALRSHLPEALKLSDYAIQMSPGSPYGHYVHAIILAKLGELKAAISELEYARNLALNQPMSIPCLSAIDQSLQELRNRTLAN